MKVIVSTAISLIPLVFVFYTFSNDFVGKTSKLIAMLDNPCLSENLPLG